MNINLNSPISVNLTSGYLISEGDGIGTVQFKIEEQPIILAITSSEYVYDTIFVVGDRVKTIQTFSILGINSIGTLQRFILDSTDDKADVYFDQIIPDNTFQSDNNNLKTQSSVISILIRVPLRILEKI